MPEIEVRPAIEADIPQLIALDHSYTTDFVWQMDALPGEKGDFRIAFREMRLPRTLKVEYPRSARALAEEWQNLEEMLVAVLGGQLAGYVALRLDKAPFTAWISDLVVKRPLRRKGIASGLLYAAEEWALQDWRTPPADEAAPEGEAPGLELAEAEVPAPQIRRLVLELQTKNIPAIRMAQKLGFDFSGYNDRYYANYDTALFFSKWIR